MPEFVDSQQEAWVRYAEELIRLQGVISVHPGLRERKGRATNEPALVVTVFRKLPLEALSPSQLVPPELRLAGGRVVGTDVVEDLAGYPTIDQDDASYRPVPGGCGIGTMAVRGFVGTLGGWFCAPQPDGESWQPVWLTNAHVVDITNQNAVPGDSRIDQPFNSGAVIGNTTNVSGWPAAVAGPGATLNGFMDAAIGTVVEEVDPDYEVLQIGDAPFEIGTPTANQAVQKRGRTSRLTQGTIFSPSVTVNVTDGRTGGGGVVAFGLPGQPPVSRIDSNAAGLAAAFGRPGDSGSLVFAQASGRLSSTVPALGLYFAGNFRGVQNSPNPNVLTVRGFMFNINAVMNQFNLELVCTCVARQIVRAILRSNRADSDVGATTDDLRRFRDSVLSRTPRGRRIADAVATAAPAMARVLTLDPVALGLAVELLEPWVDERAGMRLLTRKIDDETVERARKLATHVSEFDPSLGELLDPTCTLLEQYQGKSVTRLIGSIRKPKVITWNDQQPPRRPSPKRRGKR